MSESTNALDEGFSLSESKVDEALHEVFSKHSSNRLIIATFASNIYRLKHIIETCKYFNRKYVSLVEVWKIILIFLWKVAILMLKV